uniref:Uncharacterized protein n=1 Tax=Palpitomonas bilix TaxID=652834 RepID=A0A7S3LWM7_9EUKA
MRQRCVVCMKVGGKVATQHQYGLIRNTHEYSVPFFHSFLAKPHLQFLYAQLQWLLFEVFLASPLFQLSFEPSIIRICHFCFFALFQNRREGGQCEDESGNYVGSDRR